MERRTLPNNNVMGYAIISLCLLIATVAVFLRVHARFIVLRKALLGDYLLLSGYAIWIVYLGLGYQLGKDFGLFVHMADVSEPLSKNPTLLLPFFRTLKLLCVILSIYMVFLKSAILLEWIHIFALGNKRSAEFWAFYITLGANIIFYVSVVIMESTSCTPFAFNWDKKIDGGRCNVFNSPLIGIATSSFNLATDIVIFIIPQKVIFNLNMSKPKKYGVSIVFAIAIIGILAAAVRTAYMIRLMLAIEKDVTYYFSSVLMTCAGEGASIILVMCCPVLPCAIGSLAATLSTIGSWTTSSGQWLKSSMSMRERTSSTQCLPSHGCVSSKDTDSSLHTDEVRLVPLSGLERKAEVVGNVLDSSQRERWSRTLGQRGIIRETEVQVDSTYIGEPSSLKGSFHASADKPRK